MNIRMAKIDGSRNGGACGFFPEHVYYGQRLDRSLEICDAINSFAMEAMGFEQDLAETRKRITLLNDLSLRDMLDALECVESWNSRHVPMEQSKTINFVPAERLIAAVYTLVNFPPDDEDNLVVRYTSKYWGDDFINFLMVGRRPKSKISNAEED